MGCKGGSETAAARCRSRACAYLPRHLPPAPHPTQNDARRALFDSYAEFKLRSAGVRFWDIAAFALAGANRPQGACLGWAGGGDVPAARHGPPLDGCVNAPGASGWHQHTCPRCPCLRIKQTCFTWTATRCAT